MSIANRLFGVEVRGDFSEAHPRDPVIASWFGGGSNTAAGINVTPDTAMRLTAVAACVRILSSAIASLPLDLFTRKTVGREKNINHPLYWILHNQPNSWQTSYEYREMSAGHLFLRGNAYSYIKRRGDGAISALLPLHPDRMMPFWAPNGEIAYRYTDETGGKVTYLQSEIHHLRGFSFDGLTGLSPISHARGSLGLTLAAEEFGGRYFGNGTVLGGVLEHPNKLSDEAYDRLKASWAERHQGVGNSHKPAILEEGLKWQALGVKPEEAQFLETRKFQIAEIARIFGVPPHMIADTEKSTSWGTGIEQQGIGFVVYSLRPPLVRWEQAIKRDLLNTQGSRNLYAEFNVDGLLRGDSKARSEYYKSMFGIGVYSQNDIRMKENENPIEGGDRYFVPLNMVSVDEIGNEDDETLMRIHSLSLRRAVDRIVTAEVKAIERALKLDDADKFEIKMAEFYEKHRAFCVRHLDGLVQNPDAFANEHIRDSLTELRQALVDDDIESLLDEWRTVKVREIMKREAEKALEGVKHETRKKNL